MRVIWFYENGEPIEEKFGEDVERKHVELFKEKLWKQFDSENSLNSEPERLNLDVQPVVPSSPVQNDDSANKPGKPNDSKAQTIEGNTSVTLSFKKKEKKECSLL
jgi:hypothetical protein